LKDDRTPFVERVLERTARAMGGGRLHPLQILTEVERAALASVRDGVIANQLSVSFARDDFAAYQPALADLRAEIDALLDEVELRSGYMRIGERMVAFEVSTGVVVGSASVSARFADTGHRPVARSGAGLTQRIQLQRGWVLRLGDGSERPLTHTPFSVGRAPGNDLVLLSLAVSRNHARVVQEGGEFIIEDTESRNGLMVHGELVERAVLRPGVRVALGDVELALERTQ
jgi:Inner membrane component of T3SS, cytoplasmic domain